MKHHDPSQTSSLGNGWQILGDLELPAGSDPDEAIHSWLTGLVEPLRLPADFLNKVLVSTREACSRLLEAGNQQEPGHIHLNVRAPGGHSLRKGQNWGFFRIEKVEDRAQNDETAGHSVELYLYPEG